MQTKLIGRVLATEKNPTTMDKFNFWTDSDLKLHAFDIVKVQHIDGSFTYGVIEDISHITDAQSFLTNYISSDFGDVTVDEPTLRVGMNYALAAVSYNSSNIYIRQSIIMRRSIWLPRMRSRSRLALTRCRTRSYAAPLRCTRGRMTRLRCL